MIDFSLIIICYFKTTTATSLYEVTICFETL